MAELLQNLTFSDFLSWSLTIFSTVFGVYTWIIGKKRKELSVSCKTNEIIISGGSNIPKLTIQYDGNNIQDLSASKFYIWNSGNDVIYASDVVSNRPICIHNTGSASILNAEIVRANEESNDFAIEHTTDQEVRVSFDYVDHGEGFVLQILHSGSSQDLELDCKIKGGKEIRERSSVKRKKKEARIDYWIDVLFAALPSFLGFSLSLLSLGICLYFQDKIPDGMGTPIAFVSMFVPFVIGMLFGNKIGEYVNKKFHRTIPPTLKNESKRKDTMETDYA